MLGMAPSLSKTKLHSRYKNIDQFCTALVEICQHCIPLYTIVDGIKGIEGNGPEKIGKKQHFGVIIAQRSCTITPIVTDFYKEILCNSKIHPIFTWVGKRKE